MAMKAVRVADGTTIDYTPSSAIAAGDVQVLGTNVALGYSPRATAASSLGALDLGGVYDVQKANEQIAAWSLVYWDADGNPYGREAGSGCATTTSTGNTCIGIALEAAGATAQTVRVLALPVSVVTNTVHNALSASIADPGNGGAIPVTDTGECQIVTTGAETRTLAAPTYVGQMLLISFKTKGGNCVITCATGVNQSGNTTITLDTAGDAVLLVAKQNGSNIRWSVVMNDGASLS